MTDLPPNVIDRAQLARIEATHRGFLFQHLYTAGCLLKMADLDLVTVHVETDEDVELEWPDRRLYVQVKFRADVLRPGDIRDAVERFETYRQEHAAGRRQGAARFRILSSAPPSPGLAELMEAEGWPDDVEVVWPGVEGNHEPPAWSSLDAAIAWCEATAAALPFGQLPPLTLVLKLAALAQLLGTGAFGHSVQRADLPALLEQLVLELQDFPAAPIPYRDQVGEPSLSGDERIRLIVGVSGAGKTSWAATHAAHEAVHAIYFDVGDTPSAAIAAGLAREIAARLRDAVGQLVAGNGLDALRHVDRRLAEAALQVTVVVDNVHRLQPDDLINLTRAATSVRLVLLGQPWAGVARIEAILGVRAAALGGWALDAVAAEFASHQAAITPAEAQRVLALTAGAPLFVQSSARLAADRYGGDAGAMLTALQARSHDVETAQEILLADLFQLLPDPARSLAATLSLAEIPLTSAEAIDVAASGWVGVQPEHARLLVRLGVAQLSGGHEVRLHDGYRLLADAESADLAPEILLALRTKLAETLFASLRGQQTLPRLLRWMKLLPQVGQTKVLTDVATREFFQEIGAPPELRIALEEIAAGDADPAERFWAVDALAFWAMQADEQAEFQRWVAQQQRLLDSGQLPRRVVLAARTKSMMAAGFDGDQRGVERFLASALEACQSDNERLVVAYNHAVAIYYLGDADGAAEEAYRISRAWAAELQIDLDALDDGAWQNPIQDDDRQESIKHLADSLDLMQKAANRLGLSLPDQRRQAMLLHAHAGAIHSAVKFGQDVVEDYLGRDDAAGARFLMETHLLPALRAYDFADIYIQLRAQYAAVLAFDGAGAAALAELERIAPFEMTEAGRVDFDGQSALIAELEAAGWPTPRAFLQMRAQN